MKMCVACGKNPSESIEDYTPICGECYERGCSGKVGERVTCRIISLTGVITDTDGGVCLVDGDDGKWGWIPEADLVSIPK